MNKEISQQIKEDLLIKYHTNLLSQKQVAEYLGKKPETIKRKYGIGTQGIHIIKLANLLS